MLSPQSFSGVFVRKKTFSRRHQESLLRVKRGRKPADSTSGIQVPRKRDAILKKRICEDEPRKGSMASRSLFQMYMEEASKTTEDHGAILPAPLEESEGKKWKFPTGIVFSAEPPKPSKQEVLL